MSLTQEVIVICAEIHAFQCEKDMGDVKEASRIYWGLVEMLNGYDGPFADDFQKLMDEFQGYVYSHAQ